MDGDHSPDPAHHPDRGEDDLEEALTHDPSCIFCRIIRGEAPGHRIHEDELTVTIMDAFPASEGHALVLTREHHENIHEVPEATLCAVAAQSKRVASAIRKELSPDGLGIYQLNGSSAGQTVGHYHMHVIPRTEGQRRNVHGRTLADDESLSAVAARLAAAIEAGA
jgi:histidine triad (HIT) family protein